MKDKAVADAVCATLEAGGLRCWIAPRDVSPGGTWAQEIVQAIGGSRVLVLIFSSHSDNSEMVNRELDIATDCRLAIIPFRIEDIAPSGETRFYLAGKHWLDAMTPPLEQSPRDPGRSAAALAPPRRSSGSGGSSGRERWKTCGSPRGWSPALSPTRVCGLGGPSPVPRTEPRSHPVSHAKNCERRFKLKRWHYRVLSPGAWAPYTLLIVVPQLLGTAQNPKIAHIEICKLDAEVLWNRSFPRAISLYETVLTRDTSPEIPSELRVQMQSGLAEFITGEALNSRR